jgi:hypothetical protein
MTSSVHSIQVVHSQTQTEQSVQPPKTLQTEAASQNTGSQDMVTISQQARQALASNTKQASGGDPNPNGDNH